MTERPAAHAVLLVAWACRCARCGHEWDAPCGCPPLCPPPAEGAATEHVAGCSPPIRCAKCRAYGWERPSRGRGQAAQTPERRREIARMGVEARARARDAERVTHYLARPWECRCAVCATAAKVVDAAIPRRRRGPA